MSGKKEHFDFPSTCPAPSPSLHSKETFDDPFRTSQTLAALAAEGADERSLQELARRFQRTLAADREAKSGTKWERLNQQTQGVDLQNLGLKQPYN